MTPNFLMTSVAQIYSQVDIPYTSICLFGPTSHSDLPTIFKQLVWDTSLLVIVYDQCSTNLLHRSIPHILGWAWCQCLPWVGFALYRGGHNYSLISHIGPNRPSSVINTAQNNLLTEGYLIHWAGVQVSVLIWWGAVCRRGRYVHYDANE